MHTAKIKAEQQYKYNITLNNPAFFFALTNLMCFAFTNTHCYNI